MAKYFVGCEVIEAETGKMTIIWLRAPRRNRGPIPRACFATMHEAKAEADKRTANSKAVWGNDRFIYQPYDAHNRTPIRAPFDYHRP